MSVTIVQGDALSVLRTLPDRMFRTCVTSPPYWGLRDYGTATWDGGSPDCDHSPEARGGRFATPVSEKQASNAGSGTASRRECPCGARRVDFQLGLERSPEEYVSRLVEVFREVRRVLTDDGTLWLNLGDSFAGAGTIGRNDTTPAALARRAEKYGTGTGNGSLVGSQGRLPKVDNLKPKDLVGIPWTVAFALRADGWWLRSDIIWSKPNPMPESITDRPTKAHEYVFLLAASERYYYDADAIAEPAVRAGETVNQTGADVPDQIKMRTRPQGRKIVVGETRNKRSVWTVVTEPFPEAHFATMPQALVEPCVLAGSQQGDLVLDPFAGSGTVGVVANRHGRRFYGIDLNPEYCKMARRRVSGPLFAEED